ncbi:nucleoside deaminase [Alcaligenes sp. SDU_A2]|uniref:nucleoside deaminase n=1 Tax=Alcaligenes sp. SDU_A2 TaxID=3136634 RepID=UPI00311DCD06
MKHHYLQLALDQARLSVAQGGMPFGAVLVVDGVIASQAHNRQLQDQNYFAHAEINCLQQYMQQPFRPEQDVLLVSTEAPCPMCAGALQIAGIRRLLVGETHHYQGALDWLQKAGMHIEIMNDQGCIDLVTKFRHQYPERWNTFSAG